MCPEPEAFNLLHASMHPSPAENVIGFHKQQQSNQSQSLYFSSFLAICAGTYINIYVYVDVCRNKRRAGIQKMREREKNKRIRRQTEQTQLR